MSGAYVNPAVVLQASGPNSVAIIRSLGRLGVPVIACDQDSRALGLLSKYVTPWFTRDALTDPEGFAEDILALLVAAGWLRPLDPFRPRSATTSAWMVNPKVKEANP